MCAVPAGVQRRAAATTACTVRRGADVYCVPTSSTRRRLAMVLLAARPPASVMFPCPNIYVALIPLQGSKLLPRNAYVRIYIVKTTDRVRIDHCHIRICIAEALDLILRNTREARSFSSSLTKEKLVILQI
jgi:hypothetical protein